MDSDSLAATWSDVVALQSLGGQFAYLSDLEPASYKFVPYLSIQWPLVAGPKRAGWTARGRWQAIPKRHRAALGRSRHVQAEQHYQRFKAAIAVDDAAKGRGSVVFSVYVDRDGKWAEAYRSESCAVVSCRRKSRSTCVTQRASRSRSTTPIVAMNWITRIGSIRDWYDK